MVDHKQLYASGWWFQVCLAEIQLDIQLLDMHGWFIFTAREYLAILLTNMAGQYPMPINNIMADIH